MVTFAIDPLAQELDFKKRGSLRGIEGESYGEITEKLRVKSIIYDENRIFSRYEIIFLDSSTNYIISQHHIWLVFAFQKSYFSAC